MMKAWIFILISFFVSIGLGIIGYFLVLKDGFGSSCPVCPQPGVWSVCDDNYKKTRTSYRCSKETDYKCESYIEEGVCETSISLRGKAGLNVTVSPTKDKYVEGKVTVSIDSIPLGSGKLLVMLVPKEAEVTDNPYETPGVVIKYLDPAPKQRTVIDTRGIKSGEYNLFVASTDPNGTDDDPWLDFIQTDLTVVPVSETVSVTDFYCVSASF